MQHEILLSSSRSHNKTMNAKPMAEETQDDLCQIDREMRGKNSKMQTKILPYLTELANERLVMDTGKYIRDTMILLTMCKGCCGYNTCFIHVAAIHRVSNMWGARCSSPAAKPSLSSHQTPCARHEI